MLFTATICMMMFFSPGKCQNGVLPPEIQNFYINKNFVSLYSLKSERDLINLFLLRGKTLPEFKSERMSKIVDLIKRLTLDYGPFFKISEEDNMSLPFELLLPEVYKIYEWEKQDNQIYIWTNTYTIGPVLNDEFIKMYSSDCKAGCKFDYSKLHFKCRELQVWVFENNSWHKNTQKRILLN